MVEVRKVLVRARKRANLSQQQVVDRLRGVGVAVSGATYGHWESGRNDFRASLLPKLAIALEFTEEDRRSVIPTPP
ncbi:MAG: transcriptional regulator with XRE-family HTH domain, partial [Myxococcota bacterium]